MTIRTTGSLKVHQVGDLTRVTHSSSAPEATQVEPQPTRVANQSFALSGGQLTERGVTRHSTHQQSAPGRSVMATMQRLNGQTTVELIPGVPASRTTIDQAVRDGLVRETSPGFWEDVTPLHASGAGHPGAPAEPVTDSLAGEEQPFAYVDREHMEEWQEMIEPLPQPAYDRALAAAMASIASGDGDLDKAVQRLTKETGMDPAAAADLVGTGEAMYRESLTGDCKRPVIPS